MRNTRMKDFQDLWAIATTSAFDGATLARAVSATVAHRQTAPPVERPMGPRASRSQRHDRR